MTNTEAEFILGIDKNSILHKLGIYKSLKKAIKTPRKLLFISTPKDKKDLYNPYK